MSAKADPITHALANALSRYSGFKSVWHMFGLTIGCYGRFCFLRSMLFRPTSVAFSGPDPYNRSPQILDANHSGVGAMELNGIYSQSFDEQVPNGSHSTGSGSATQDSELTRPNSADSSQHYHAPSNQSSSASLSIEERLRRVRAAEQLKQQQRYAAYVEAQQQAEMARMRQQEERKRRIEEMRQKEQMRRLSALERRAALELSNQVGFS
ncbi:unnamed protein product [Schistosoma mattheei]|uniref:Uncharacterized protein n=1 Tax=Schistosoma mattheei TaxID=31246 RepID=A0A183NUX9_9TREM|nr:unnamed protein product [Schistosoma mattheei]